MLTSMLKNPTSQLDTDACMFPTQNTKQKPYVRRDGDLQNSSGAQKGKLHQAWLLSIIILLLPLSVSFARTLCVMYFQPSTF